MAVRLTATPERATARVKIVARGGVPGEPLYVFRRDADGVNPIRDTSAGTIAWPVDGEQLATNLIDNGELADTEPDGTISGLLLGADASAVRDTQHPLPGAAGATLRIRWGSTTYPDVNLYPAPTLYPRG